LYYYHKEGENKLASKGLLDRQGRPTSLAFNFIPENVLKKMTQDLHFQLIQLQEEKNRIENAFFDSSSGLRKMKEQVEESESSLRNVTQKLAVLNQTRIMHVLKTFEFLGIDDNWISVSVP